MKKRLIVALILAGLPLAMAGCGTFANTCWLTEAEGGNKIYGGVRGDWEIAHENIAAASDPHKNPEPVWIPIVDMPFSLIGDTVTLPITMAISISRAFESVQPERVGSQSTSPK